MRKFLNGLVACTSGCGIDRKERPGRDKIGSNFGNRRQEPTSLSVFTVDDERLAMIGSLNTGRVAGLS
jgi:hypothetical protein